MRRVASPLTLKVRSAWGPIMAKRNRRVKRQLGIEALEDRALMSAYGVVLKGVSTWGGEPDFVDVRHNFLPWFTWGSADNKLDPTIPLTPQGYPTAKSASTYAF